MFCANALLLREGRPCEECVGRIPWPGLRHGCYRGSRLATAPVAFVGMAARGPRDLAGRGRSLHRAFPVRARALRRRRTAPRTHQRQAELPRRRTAAAGELRRRRAVRRETCAGEGDSGPARRSAAGRSNGTSASRSSATGPCAAWSTRPRTERGRVRAAGAQSRSFCLEAMRRALFVVVPSVCYENFPLTIVEAFACGTPVLASRLGAMAELVEDGRTGRLFAAGDAADLAAAMEWLTSHPAECAAMGRAARLVFEERYTAARIRDAGGNLPANVVMKPEGTKMAARARSGGPRRRAASSGRRRWRAAAGPRREQGRTEDILGFPVSTEHPRRAGPAFAGLDRLGGARPLFRLRQSPLPGSGAPGPIFRPGDSRGGLRRSRRRRHRARPPACSGEPSGSGSREWTSFGRSTRASTP